MKILNSLFTTLTKHGLDLSNPNFSRVGRAAAIEFQGLLKKRGLIYLYTYYFSQAKL